MSARSSSAWAFRNGGRLTPPDSSSPSSRIETGIGQPAGDGLPGPAGLDEGHQLALVVGGAARADRARAVRARLDGRLEGVVVPELERIDRLHVVVAIEQRRRTRRAAVMADDDRDGPAWRARCASKPMLFRSSTCHSAQARHSAAKAGSVEIDLILSSSNSRSRAASRSASMRDRTASSCDMMPLPSSRRRSWRASAMLASAAPSTRRRRIPRLLGRLEGVVRDLAGLVARQAAGREDRDQRDARP